MRVHRESRGNRRRFVVSIGAAAVCAPLALLAQQPVRLARIGFLAGDTRAANPQRMQAFRDALRQLGYLEGQNVVIEPRWAEGKFERLPELAAELVRLPVDVIVAAGDPVIATLRQATSTIPIVMASVGDPVGRGFIASLARPGGNVTGVSNFAETLMGKWLELLKELVPALSRVAVLRNAGNATHDLFWRDAESRATTLGLTVRRVDVRDSDDLERAFAAVVDARAGALVVLPDPLLSGLAGRRIVEFANRNRLPSMCTFKEQVEAGGLFSYGPDLTANYQRAAVYVDKLLRGAKPADLPVEQPTKFVSAINLRTARAIGLPVAQTFLLRADEVVE